MSASSADARSRRQMRWQLAQFAKLASIFSAVISPATAVAASPMTMRLAASALGSQTTMQTTGLGLNRRSSDGQSLNNVEESLMTETSSPVPDSKASAKDRLAQRLVLQQKTAPSSLGATTKLSKDKNQVRLLRQLENVVAEGSRQAVPSPAALETGTTERRIHDHSASLEATESRESPVPPYRPVSRKESWTPPQSLKAGVYAAPSTAKPVNEAFNEAQSPHLTREPQAHNVAQDGDHEPHSNLQGHVKERALQRKLLIEADDANAAESCAPTLPQPAAMNEPGTRKRRELTNPLDFKRPHEKMRFTKTKELQDSQQKDKLSKLSEGQMAPPATLSSHSNADAADKPSDRIVQDLMPSYPDSSVYVGTGQLLCGGRIPCAVGSPVHVDAEDDHSSESASWLKSTVASEVDLPSAADGATRRSTLGRSLFDFAADAAVPVAITAESLLGAKADFHIEKKISHSTSALVKVPEQSNEIKDPHHDYDYAATDYMTWLQTKLEESTPDGWTLQTKLVGCAIWGAWLDASIHPAWLDASIHAAATPVPEDGTCLDSADLDKQLAVARERVQATEAVAVALQKLLTSSTGVSSSSSSTSELSAPSSSSLLEEQNMKMEETCAKLAAAAMSEEQMAADEEARATPIPNHKNWPARKPSAVPAPMRPAETWGRHRRRERFPVLANADFGIRLLAAIRETEDARERARAGGAVSYRKGKELIHLATSTSSIIPDHLHSSPAPAHQDASSKTRTFVAPEHTQEPRDSNSYDEESSERLFSRRGARERATKRFARTAKSTMRAAGAAVTSFGTKLWIAAGKALSDEVNEIVVSDEFDKNGAAEGQEEEGGPHRGWHKLFSRFRAGRRDTSKGDPHSSSDRESFARFFEDACRQRGGDDCSQEAKSAYGLLEESRRQHVHLLEANLWGGLLAKRLETARTKPYAAYVSEAVWTPGKWAGMFVQDEDTEMEMQLELVALSPDGTCSGLISWANGHSVTAFEGNVVGNQINFEEMRVVKDYSDGEFVPGTRYRLWKDGGDGPGMEGTWLHPTLMVWGYLNLKMVVEDALVHTGTHHEEYSDIECPPHKVCGASFITTASTNTGKPAGSVRHAAASMPEDGKAIGAVTVQGGCMWTALACALALTLVVMPNRTKAWLRQLCCCSRTAWEYVTSRAASREERGRTRRRSTGAATDNKPRIDIPAEAFRAVGRSVLRNSSASISSPMSSSSSSVSQPSTQKSGTLDRAREVLLMASSAVSSSPSDTQMVTSSVESSDLQSSLEEEQKLVSVMELEKLRKSLDEDSTLQMDASWVMFEDDAADAERQETDGSWRNGKPPRISDMSAASTQCDRRSSNVSESAGSAQERRISHGWLAVAEDALAASASALQDSLDD